MADGLGDPRLQRPGDGRREHRVVHAHHDGAGAALDGDEARGVGGGDAPGRRVDAGVQAGEELQEPVDRAVAAQDGGQHVRAADDTQDSERIPAGGVERIVKAAERARRELAVEADERERGTAAVEAGLAAGARVWERVGDERVEARGVDACVAVGCVAVVRKEAPARAAVAAHHVGVFVDHVRATGGGGIKLLARDDARLGELDLVGGGAVGRGRVQAQVAEHEGEGALLRRVLRRAELEVALLRAARAHADVAKRAVVAHALGLALVARHGVAGGLQVVVDEQTAGRGLAVETVLVDEAGRGGELRDAARAERREVVAGEVAYAGVALRRTRAADDALGVERACLAGVGTRARELLVVAEEADVGGPAARGHGERARLAAVRLALGLERALEVLLLAFPQKVADETEDVPDEGYVRPQSIDWKEKLLQDVDNGLPDVDDDVRELEHENHNVAHDLRPDVVVNPLYHFADCVHHLLEEAPDAPAQGNLRDGPGQMLDEVADDLHQGNGLLEQARGRGLGGVGGRAGQLRYAVERGHCREKLQEAEAHADAVVPDED